MKVGENYFVSFENANPSEINELAIKNLIDSVKRVAKLVPAYKSILKKEKINPESINSIYDFEKLPILTKNNFFPFFLFHYF